MKFQSAVLACLSITSVIFGQNVSSSVKGEVTDPSGAAVAGATCTLTNQVTSQSMSVKSFSDGLADVSGRLTSSNIRTMCT
jgi:hypothetical protein